ncbi:IS110 family transposase [Sphingobium scionense]
MDGVSIVGLDLAKRVFQAHGACSNGHVIFRKKLSRSQLVAFLARQPRCIVAMEACASAHFWGRAIRDLGHEVRLIPPIYVKPFVKRQKNDAADAEAIAEAAVRNMRFVEVKSQRQQAGAMVFRTRDLLVRQRTQLKHGVVAPQGVTNVRILEAAIEEAETSLDLLIIETARLYLTQIASLSEQIVTLEKVLQQEAGKAATTARLLTVPGIGHVTAMAIEAFAPPMETFRRGRDFAAWLGLVPIQRSTGGKQVLGRTSKMGQRDIRRLLITGAMTIVRWASRKAPPEGSWLSRMLERKPRMLVAIALANKMARSVWAMLTKDEDYRNPVAVAA